MKGFEHQETSFQETDRGRPESLGTLTARRQRQGSQGSLPHAAVPGP